MAIVYGETGTIWENYSPEYPAPGNIAKRDSVGFSGLGPIALLIEEILGIEVDAPANTIRWQQYPTPEQGISNLRFGDNVVSLLAWKADGGETTIEVIAQRECTLEVQRAGARATFSVAPGTHRHEL